MNKHPTIIYCATGKSFLEEASISINSIRKIYPKIEIVLYTDEKEYENFLINKIEIIEKPFFGFKDKIKSIIDIDRESILFLDCDTFLMEPIDELFEILEMFDIAMTHAIYNSPYHQSELSNTFHELNTGVIAMRKTGEVKRFLNFWSTLYEEQLVKGEKLAELTDQPSFRYCLYHSAIRFYVLKPEFNFRFNFGSCASSRIKILHGRDKNILKVAKLVRKMNEGFERGNSHMWFVKIKRYSVFVEARFLVKRLISRLKI